MMHGNGRIYLKLISNITVCILLQSDI